MIPRIKDCLKKGNYDTGLCEFGKIFYCDPEQNTFHIFDHKTQQVEEIGHCTCFIVSNIYHGKTAIVHCL